MAESECQLVGKNSVHDNDDEDGIKFLAPIRAPYTLLSSTFVSQLLPLAACNGMFGAERDYKTNYSSFIIIPIYLGTSLVIWNDKSDG